MILTQRQTNYRENINESQLFPSWIFDVDESDENLISDQTLLQELDIDLTHIRKTLKFMQYVVLIKILNIVNFKHRVSPIIIENPLILDKAPEFWGPFAVVSVYALVLWLGKVRNVSWIFLIWLTFSFFNHLVTRVTFKSTYALHMYVMGYSIVPIVPWLLMIIIFRPAVWLASSIQIISIIWASITAYISYSTLLSNRLLSLVLYIYIYIYI